MTILTATIFLVTGWLIYNRVPSYGQLASSVLLLPSATTAKPVVLWTLKQDLLFYAMFSLAFIRPRFDLAAVFVWGVAAVFLPDTGVLTHRFFNIQNVQFLFGILAAYNFVTFPIRPGAAPWLAASSIPGVLIASLYFKQVDLNQGVPAVLLVAAFAALARSVYFLVFEHSFEATRNA